MPAPAPLESTFYVYPEDLVGEGPPVVLDALRDRAGVRGVNLAVTYHASRALHPHNPAGAVFYSDPGVLAFPLDPALWRASRLRPGAPSAAGDLLAELCAGAGERGMDTNAWTVFFHSDRLGFEHPDCATRSAFGDPFSTDLCPANPVVQEYAHTLVESVARHPVRDIRAESLHYHPWRHGYHHEFQFVQLRPLDELLLGLCFCEHCRAVARGAGIDIDAVQRVTRSTLEERFAAAPEADPENAEPTLEDLRRLAGADLDRFLAERARVVTSLTAALRRRAEAHGTSLTFVDLTGVVKPAPVGEAASLSIDNGWRNGMDAAALAKEGSAIAALAYGAGVGDLAADLDGYLRRVPADRLTVSLLPWWPDCLDATVLAEKVGEIRARAIPRVDFWNYGLVPSAALDWVRQALGEP